MADTSAAKLRIGLNALLLSTSQATYRSAGIHNYMSGLLPHLPAADERFAYTAYVAGDQPGLNGAMQQRLSGRAANHPVTRIAWEQFVQPVVSLRERVDLLHAMAFVSPLAAPLPQIVTVYDLSFRRLPRRFHPNRRAYLSMFTRLSCRRARRVIAISEHTRRDVATEFGIHPDRIDVVYPGCDPVFRRAPADEVSAFRERRGLPDKFILYLGTIEPRKNLSTLITAFAKLRARGIKLICAGGRGWMFEDVFQTVEELHLSRDVIFPGFVPREELPLWYSAARVFVYPSSYEGFGIPVLEAMACGVPTITTNASSLPEVAGETARMVDPGDSDALAHALHELLHDDALRAQLSAAGPARARLFTWEEAAHLTTRSYARALRLPTR